MSATAKRKILVIGIGAGNPDYLTLQAVKAMQQADVFFIPDKGDEKEELQRTRREMLSLHVTDARVVGYQTPARKISEEAYQGSIREWQDAVEAVFARLIAGMGETETGAFLVWGDPSLYDGTMRILDRIKAKAEVIFDYDVIPGISAISALAARHKTALNSIGGSCLISSARPLAEGMPAHVDNVAVMLATEKALAAAHSDSDSEVYWGAYVGMPDEILLSGKLVEMGPKIAEQREMARKRKGWIMDSVLLKKPEA